MSAVGLVKSVREVFNGAFALDPATISGEIRAARRVRLDSSLARGDLEGASDIFAPDAYFVNNGIPTARSRRGPQESITMH